MKKLLLIVLCMVLAAGSFGCEKKEIESDRKIKIVTTVFPLYDFAKNVTGDNAEVILLLPAGAEAHSYEPTVQDVVKIHECDLFLRLGMGADPWSDAVISDKGNNGKVLSAMECVQLRHEEHDHGDSHEYEYDQHIWTSLKNSVDIVRVIADEIADIDADNAEYYKENARQYEEKLRKLDEKFLELTKNYQGTLVFADRFPFRYFTEDYALKSYAAYPGCSSESEPSAATVAQIIDRIKQNKISTVFYTETSNGQLPDAICEETGVKKELLHSCHTVSKEELENNVTYIELMENNYNSLKALIQK